MRAMEVQAADWEGREVRVHVFGERMKWRGKMRVEDFGGRGRVRVDGGEECGCGVGWGVIKDPREEVGKDRG